jgi:hypothetical protein
MIKGRFIRSIPGQLSSETLLSLIEIERKAHRVPSPFLAETMSVFLLQEILHRRKQVGSEPPLRPICFFVKTRLNEHLKKALAEIPGSFRITPRCRMKA